MQKQQCVDKNMKKSDNGLRVDERLEVGFGEGYGGIGWLGVSEAEEGNGGWERDLWPKMARVENTMEQRKQWTKKQGERWKKGMELTGEQKLRMKEIKDGENGENGWEWTEEEEGGSMVRVEKGNHGRREWSLRMVEKDGGGPRENRETAVNGGEWVG